MLSQVNISEAIDFKLNFPYMIFGYPPPNDPSAFTAAGLSPPPLALLQINPCDSKSLDRAEWIIRLLGSGRTLPATGEFQTDPLLR
jgi:hypothetical protein